VDAVITGKRGEAQVGDDEPLGRNVAPAVLGDTYRARDHGIGARLQLADGLADREGRRHLAIELG